MTSEIPIYQIDAFASRVFAGNPAAVCPLEAWLPDDVLQGIAAENNLAETAYLLARDDGDYDLRWFTPAVEVDLCGHATLASAYVIDKELEPGRGHVRFHSRSGPLEVTREGDIYALDFPSHPPTPVTPDLSQAVAEALGSQPLEVHQAKMFLALLADQDAVLAAKPDLQRVKDLLGDGLIITAPGEDCDFVSRYFAPHAGIPEDPVTGSAHCRLTPFWARRLDKARLTARQVSRRGGELLVEDCGERVKIAGRCAYYMSGRITV
jgi:PhzF family phenazine biosynthesis protein